MRVQETESRFGVRSFRSMNTDVSVTLALPQTQVDRLVEEIALPAFANAESACSRFIPDNPLAVVNSAPSETHSVPELLYRAVAAAYESYQLTEGLFDPRVLNSLRTLGYRQSFDASAPARGTAQRADQTAPLGVWQPTLSHAVSEYRINLDGHPIDLGGIGKGLTVDEVAAALKPHAASGCVDAGGDMHLWGSSPEQTAWKIGIEHPLSAQADELIAVLELTNTGIATSSSRKRQWHTEDGESVHHIIDPRTGLSAHNAIRSVTVAHPRTRLAETMTKALFLAGEANIADVAQRLGVRALWVTADGSVHTTPDMNSVVIWRAAS